MATNVTIYYSCCYGYQGGKSEIMTAGVYSTTVAYGNTYTAPSTYYNYEFFGYAPGTYSSGSNVPSGAITDTRVIDTSQSAILSWTVFYTRKNLSSNTSILTGDSNALLQKYVFARTPVNSSSNTVQDSTRRRNASTYPLFWSGYKDGDNLSTPYGIQCRTDMITSGYRFTGWTMSPNNMGTIGNASNALTTFLPSTTGTITATFAANTYTIHFDGNGATSGTMSNQSMTCHTPSNLTTNAFERTNYNFSGWNTSQDGSGTPYSNGVSVNNLTYTNGATVTLYAQWSLNTTTVTYSSNDKVVGHPTQVTKTPTIGSNVDLSNISGWTYLKGYYPNGWLYNGSHVDTLIAIDSPMSLTVDTQLTTYRYKTINNGTETLNEYVITDCPITLPTLTREGYTFLHWYKDGEPKTQITAEESDSYTTPVYTAHWRKDNYVKVGDDLKKIKDGYVKVGGYLKKITEAYVKTSDGLKRIL